MKDLKLRYWMFVIPQYYPAGGLKDVKFTTDDLAEAKQKMKSAINDEEWDRDDNYSLFDSVDREYISL